MKRALLYLQRIIDVDKSDPVSSLRIVWYLKSKLKFDACWGWDASNLTPELPESIDELWFVCSSWLYLSRGLAPQFRQHTLKIFPLAKRVIWCNNDVNMAWHGYQLGRCQPTARLAALSIVAKTADRFQMLPEVGWTLHGTFDWNRLTYLPPATIVPIKDRLARIYYYGTMRPDRLRTFDRYLPVWGSHLTLSAANNRDRKKFADRYPTIEVKPRTDSVFSSLGGYVATAILEDRYAHKHYSSPPNRFYEALSVGTAMYFEAEAVDQWRANGYDVRPFVIPKTPGEMIDRAPRVARQQRKWAKRPFRASLDLEFERWLKAIRTGKVGIVGPPLGLKRYL
jgi:hypothetical protein